MGFDPYQQWLQIPSRRRPPTYYDLLGLAEDESDTQRIDEAGAQRYEHVRKYVLGPYGQQANRILAELSKAVTCLTDPKRRQQYDRRLCEQADRLAEATVTPGPEEAQPQWVLLWDEAVATGGRKPPELPAASKVHEKKRPSLRAMGSGLLRLAVLAGVAPFRTADFLLRKIAGKDNTILHNFLRCVAALVVAGTVVTLFGLYATEPLLSAFRYGRGDLAEEAEAEPGSNSDNDWRPTSPKTGRPADLTLWQVAGQVACVAFHPQRPLLATGDFNGTARLWNADTGRLRRRLPGHAGMVLFVAFSPDGDALATASADGSVKLWETGTAALRRTIEVGQGCVQCTAFSPDGSRLATASEEDGVVRLWHCRTGELQGTFESRATNVLAVAISGDGSTLASGHWDGSVRVFNAATGELRHTLTGLAPVESVAFSPDGSTVASASWDKTVRLHDTAHGSLLRTLSGHTDRVLSVAFSPRGLVLASAGADGTARLWDPATGRPLRTFSEHTDAVISIGFSSDGSTLASAAADQGVLFWDLTTEEIAGRSTSQDRPPPSPEGPLPSEEVPASGGGTGETAKTPGQPAATLPSAGDARMVDPFATTATDGPGPAPPQAARFHLLLHGHADGVSAVAFGPDGSWLVSGSPDRTVGLWDTATGGLVRLPARFPFKVECIAVDPLGSTVAAGGLHSTVRLFTVITGTHHWEIRGHRRVYGLAFSPGGTLLASAVQDGTIRLCNPITRKYQRTLAGQHKEARCVAFSPDGLLLASGGSHATVVLWDVAVRKPRRKLRGHTGQVNWVAFSPDGSLLASAGEDTTVRLWEVASGEQKRVLADHSLAVRSVAFCPHGSTLASAGADNTLRLWDPAAGRLRQTLKGHAGAVNSIAFSPDGRLLASAGSDGTVILWRMPAGD